MNGILIFSVFAPVLFGLGVRALGAEKERAAKALAMLGAVSTSLSVLLLLLSNGASLTLVRFDEALSLGFAVDGPATFFAALVALLWPFALWYAFCYMKEQDNRVAYFSYYLMTYGVVLGIAFAANALTMYVFYEALTFISLPLITHTQTKEARKAGRVYLYYSLSGSSLALAGIIIVTVLVGSNDYALGGILASDDGMVQFAYLLTFFGFGVKAAVFPLCRWLPMAGAAPTPTTALLHAVAVVKSGAFAVLRMTYCLFSPSVLRGTAAQTVALAVIAVTIVYGSAMALREQHLKRRFAYSTIANLSYILFGMLLCSADGAQASLLHFVMHSFTKIAIFFCVGAMMERSGAHYVYEMNGMAKKMPCAIVLYALAGFSLVGIPPFGGFVSKYYLVSAGMRAGSTVAALGVAAVILSAVLTAAYVFTVLCRACFAKPLDGCLALYENAKDLDRGFALTVGVFAVLSLLAGIAASPLCDFISRLIGGAV